MHVLPVVDVASASGFLMTKVSDRNVNFTTLSNKR